MKESWRHRQRLFNVQEENLGDGGVDVDNYDHYKIEDGPDDSQHG